MLTQYTVSWVDSAGDEKSFVLYAKNSEDARKQVRAPKDAQVKASNLSRKDLEQILLGRQRGF